jgi:hypothetical protein
MISLDARKLRALIERKLDNMMRLDASRYDVLDRSRKMIAAYFNCAMSNGQLFEELVAFRRVSVNKLAPWSRWSGAGRFAGCPGSHPDE